MNTIDKIQEALDAVKADAEKFFNKGTKAAGTRVRTGSMDIIKLCKQLREEVQAVKQEDK
ncbi:MAG: histone H1 [Geobacter sp.]